MREWARAYPRFDRRHSMVGQVCVGDRKSIDSADSMRFKSRFDSLQHLLPRLERTSKNIEREQQRFTARFL